MTSSCEADTESKCGYHGGISSKLKSKGKEKAQEIQAPKGFEFGKVFVCVDGLHRKKSEDGEWELLFKVSGTLERPAPSPAEFDKAKHIGHAAECDLRNGPWKLPLDMEVDSFMDFLSSILPNLVHHLRASPDHINKSFSEDSDPQFKQFLPPVIALVSTGRRLVISAGAMEYPTVPFVQNLSRCCPNRSKRPDAQHTLYILTRSPITKEEMRSWKMSFGKEPPPSTQPRVKVKAADNEQDDIIEFTDNEVEDASSSINNSEHSASGFNSSDSDIAEGSSLIPRPRRLHTRGRPIAISSDVEENIPDQEDTSHSRNHTDTEREDNEVSLMFQSMASVSEHPSTPPPPPAVMNDPTVILDIFSASAPKIKF
ncbi:hypothetical protein PQX77_014960 [Marasmius sp. AFHP31]|nr:hypothetical protein PQX77_018359 [Marasmius sp. AFHP31]KAK1220236.1 hypothetical protein PQX77_017022 [Marasmius sp. AFHP31]KAK1222199.1 hypothetical protein PQX77_014960 [Marasmius sp. AFHP31]